MQPACPTFEASDPGQPVAGPGWAAALQLGAVQPGAPARWPRRRPARPCPPRPDPPGPGAPRLQTRPVQFCVQYRAILYNIAAACG